MDIIEIQSLITTMQLNCHVAIICIWNLWPEAVFEISVGPTVRDREVVCRTDNKLNLPVLLSDNISDRVFTNL